jgi:signal peptidase I
MSAHMSLSKTAGRYWNSYRSLLFFLVLMLLFRSAFADWVTVPTGSMNPTIIEGDRVLVDKHVFGLRVPFTLVHLTGGQDPARGDIVVFDSPENGKSLVKRIIGVPGDQIELNNERLFVNGQAASYHAGDANELRQLLASTMAESPVVLREAGYGKQHDILLLPYRYVGSFGPVTVPSGMYFMMGDNRDNSADSRVFGFVPRRNIVGRATRVVVSLNPESYYAPRKNRFLTTLN